MSEAYAISSVMLYDPDFREFAFINIPIIGSIIMALWEFFYLRKFIKTTKSLDFYVRLLAANILSFVINFVILALILALTGRTISDADSDFLELFTALIFILIAAANGLWQKTSALKKISEIDKKLTRNIFAANLISYLFLSIFLYLEFF